MTSIASKNLYELLGNDPEQDPERRTPEQPTKAIDKPVARSGKREAGPAPPATTGPPRGGGEGRGRGRGGRGGASGNERAFREGAGGRDSNRSANPDDLPPSQSDRPPRGEGYRGRGREGFRGRGRGNRGGARNDRHSQTGVGDHQKQAAHGWGGPTGNDELADEKAGEAIAKTEEKEGWDSSPAPPVDGEGEAWAPDGDAAGNEEPAEPEGPKSKSYEEYLAELAEKKLTLGGELSTRKANEGASKKFPEGKAFARNDEEENFFIGSGGKAGRVREKKEKQVVDMSGIDPRSYLAEERGAADRGGRGGRGGRGRGEGRGRGRGGDRGDFRGDRGDRAERGDRADRGDRAARGDRTEYRGRGGRGGNAPRLDDSSAFPTLGS